MLTRIQFKERVHRKYDWILDDLKSHDKIALISQNLLDGIDACLKVKSDLPYFDKFYSASFEDVMIITEKKIPWEYVLTDTTQYHNVKQMEAGQAEGKTEIPVLFEEMDGVWLFMQDSAHKKMKKQEMKVFTMYEGWDAESGTRSCLVNKAMLAGMENSDEFHRKREALVEKTYNADEIQQRILNGDGGSWIKEPYDQETIFQLDRFHIYQEIKRRLSDKEAQKAVTELFDQEKIDEMLEYIRIYADSVSSNDESDSRSSNAMKLYSYLSNNKDGLLPYQKRGIHIPEPREGIVYKNMGVQENQNCTTITMRMKHRRMRWSPSGANNMAKALYRKENGELIETIDRYTDGLVFTMQMQEALETLSAAKAPKKDGKGNKYADIISHHIPLQDAMRTAARKAFITAFCQ